mgnify:CR=1 FL=1
MRAFEYCCAEPWAIEPAALRLIAALAQRNHEASSVKERRDWTKYNFALRAGPGATKLPGAVRAVLQDGVAILPVIGPIFPRANLFTEISGATPVSALMNDYRAAYRSSDVGAIMLLIDSPGGAVSGISAFVDLLFAGAKTKRTVAHVEGSAASAAYWIASATSEVTAERTGIVGSIGVVAAIPKQVQADSDGFIDVEIVSSNAPNKRPDPTSDGGASEIRATLDAIEQQFIADVARGRGTTPKKVAAEFGQGGVKIGVAAKAAGMVDKVTNFELAFAAAKRVAREEITRRMAQRGR